MTARDHTAYREEIGAYLLGALTDLELQAFEHHMESCAQCRDEVERLRPAAEALPRSVEQVEPPRSLRTSLMDVVAKEARERPAARAPRRSLRERLLPRGLLRPALVGAALAVGLLAGFGVAQLGGEEGDEVRTFAATVRPGAASERQREREARGRRRERRHPAPPGDACPRRRSCLSGLGPARRHVRASADLRGGPGRERRRGASGRSQRREGRARDPRAAGRVAGTQRAAASQRHPLRLTGHRRLRARPAPLL